MRNLNIRLRSLAIFRALLDDPVISSLCDYLDSLERDNAADSVSKYAAFVSGLYGQE